MKKTIALLISISTFIIAYSTSSVTPQPGLSLSATQIMQRAHPATGFVQLANYTGAKTVEINLEPSNLHTEFYEQHYAQARQLLPEYVKQLLSSSR